MAEAMTIVGRAGKHPEETAALLFQALAQGTLLGRAEHLVAKYTDDTSEYWNHPVLPDLWMFCPLPPLGHDFWTRGDIQISPEALPDGTVLTLGDVTTELPFGALLPIITIRGLWVPRDGVVALCRSFGAAGPVGRRRGVGGFAKQDLPLIQEMRERLANGSSTSIHAAAVAVASKAKGGGVMESKVRRLVERYRAAYPNSP